MKKVLVIIACIFVGNIYAQNIGLIWQISGNGLKDTSYILGTNHALDQSLKIPLLVKSRILKSSVFICESKPGFFGQMQGAFAIFNKGLKSFARDVDSSNMKMIRSLCIDSLKIEKSNYQSYLIFNPLVLGSIIEDKVIEKEIGHKPICYSLDDSLKRFAHKNKLKIRPLEGANVIKKAFENVSMKEHFEMSLGIYLNKSVKEIKDSIIENNKYTSGKLDAPFCCPDKMTNVQRKFYSSFLIDRNFEWISQIEKQLRKQSVFIAVGLDHVLPANYGLIDILRAKGYKVECIMKEFKE